MGFESGSVGMRLFHLPQPLTEEHIEQFEEYAAPSFDAAQEEPVYGWVTGRHMMDRQITEEHAMFGGYIRLQLLEITRKIPTSLLQAEMKQEELVRLAAFEKPFLSRKDKSEIRQEVKDRLLPNMPPQLKTIPFVARPGDQSMMATAMNDKQCDLLVNNLRHVTGINPMALDPDVIALNKFKIDTNSWTPSSYSEEIGQEVVVHHPGIDFLTWLWFYAESHEGLIDLTNTGRVGLVLEGPLTFVMEGGGAQEVVLKKGNPPSSREAVACLLSGKKLSKAKINLAIGEELWAFNLDAETFIFRSIKLPEPEELLEPVSKFQDRMTKLEMLRDAMLELYELYINERRNVRGWAETVMKMRKWVVERKTVA